MNAKFQIPFGAIGAALLLAVAFTGFFFVALPVLHNDSKRPPLRDLDEALHTEEVPLESAPSLDAGKEAPAPTLLERESVTPPSVAQDNGGEALGEAAEPEPEPATETEMASGQRGHGVEWTPPTWEDRLLWPLAERLEKSREAELSARADQEALALAEASKSTSDRREEGTASVNNLGLADLIRGELHPGIVRPKRRARISAPADGRVVAVLVREGDFVEAEAALFRLDDAVARAMVQSAAAAAERTARMAAAAAQIEHLEGVLTRIRNAAKDGAASQLEVGEAEANLAQARASLLSAEEEGRQSARALELEEVRLSERAVRSPIAGVVRRITAKEGDSVRGGQEVLQVVDLQTLEVELWIPLAETERFVIGELYPLVSGAPTTGRLMARLIAKDPIIDGAAGTQRGLFEIDNRMSRFAAGFFARLAALDEE